jgi:CDP-diacylglycerol pyrophosphatase
MVLRINSKALWLEILFALTVTIGVAPKAIALSVAKSDILMHIASQCVDPSKVNYCSNCMLPRSDASCTDLSECKKNSEVWALNQQYVAIRDIKMCGCPTDFVHGLAMPRDIVTGVEDANRQENIWQFSWDVAIERMEPSSIALVVNPKSQRTQNQLHIHLVRLDKNARINLPQYSPIYVDSLEYIWAAAEKDALAKDLNDYGVLVAQLSPSKYMVVVTPSSPEAAFTQWSCN